MDNHGQIGSTVRKIVSIKAHYNLMYNVGQDVQHYLRLKGKSQRQMARIIGVSPSTLGDSLERASWPTDRLWAACEYLDVNLFQSIAQSFEAQRDPHNTPTKDPEPQYHTATVYHFDEHLFHAAMNVHNQMIEHHLRMQTEHPMTAAAEDSVDSAAELLHWMRRRNNL